MSSSELSSSSICWISSLRFRSLSSSSDFDFGDAHRGRAIRIQSGGNQRVCNFQDVLKLFFKRPPSFCIHWRFSLSPIVAAADSDQLRLSFFHCSAPILCRSSLCVPRYRTIRSPAVLPGSIGWSTATTSYAFRPLFAPATPFCPSFQVLDCNSAMSRSRQSLAGSRIADFTLKLIWAPGQPTIWPGRKLPRYATFRQIKGPRGRLRQASSQPADFGYRPLQPALSLL